MQTRPWNFNLSSLLKDLRKKIDTPFRVLTREIYLLQGGTAKDTDPLLITQNSRVSSRRPAQLPRVGCLLSYEQAGDSLNQTVAVES